MALLKPSKLLIEDFKDQASWIGKLFSTLNSFTGDIVSAFTNNITINDNLLQELKDIQYLNNAASFPLSFKTKFPSISPKGLTPVYLFDIDAQSYSTQAPWVVWTYNNGQIFLTDVSGLTSGHTYVLRVLVMYG